MSSSSSAPSSSRAPFTLLVHGGAGDTLPCPHEEAVHRAGLRFALESGYAVLAEGGSALDAVAVAVSCLENDRSFNSAAGAVFTTKGEVELEASIVTSAPPAFHAADSKEALSSTSVASSFGLTPVPGPIPSARRLAALSYVQHTKNPVLAARALYLNPQAAPHTYFVGAESERLAWGLGGSKEVEQEYFYTRKRWLEHRRELGLPDYDDAHPSEMFDGLDITADGQPPAFNAGVQPPHYTSRGGSSANSTHSATSPACPAAEGPKSAKGTVGAVALDMYGTIACATSTGGKNNKLPGRLGDSAAPGAGSWAETWVDERAASTSEKEEKEVRKSLLSRFASLCGSTSSSEPLSEAKAPAAKHRGVGLSCTGDGDVFLKVSAGALVAHRARFLGESVGTAAEAMIREFEGLGGEGGVIALDERGEASFITNCKTMNRGVISSTDGVPRVAIWAHEEVQ